MGGITDPAVQEKRGEDINNKGGGGGRLTEHGKPEEYLCLCSQTADNIASWMPNKPRAALQGQTC
jgi:hypothetical protein